LGPRLEGIRTYGILGTVGKCFLNSFGRHPQDVNRLPDADHSFWVPQLAGKTMALRHANPVLVSGTFLLSLGFLYFAARLALIRSSQSARRLLLVSVVYLPLVFLLQGLARV
jgi:hypothetical protein